MTSNLSKFTSYCKNIQPQAQEDIRRFFEGVVGFPYDKELLLQAYVFLNINKLFPLCSELLLLKSPLLEIIQILENVILCISLLKTVYF